MPEAAQDLESSPESEPQDVDSEQSSSSDDVGHSSMEDAIRSVVASPERDDDDQGEEADEADGEPAGSSPEGVGGEPESGDQPAEVDEDAQFIELLKSNDVPLGKIDRFKELLEERNQFRESTEQLQSVQSQLAEIQVAGQEAGLSQEQLTTLFSIPMMLAKDPAAAFEAINGLREFVAQNAGEELPADLQQKVEDGYMDEESARELARTRAEAQHASRRVERTEQDRQQEAARIAQQSVIGAVNTFQQTLRESDPDYDHKHSFVKRELSALVRERGTPQSPEQAVEWAKEAHATVTKELGFLKPARRPARTLSGKGTNRSAAAAPASMYEAVLAAVDSTPED